jgi:hypothetical protein
MEFGAILVASAALISSIALSIINLKESTAIYSELSSASNLFECHDPISQIFLGQTTSAVIFAGSDEPCLFPNTYNHGERHQNPSLEIFQDVLAQIVGGQPN